MIDEGWPSGPSLQIPKRRHTMLKTISAALLAVSVLAAPALAATSGKTNAAPAPKQTPVTTSDKTTDKTAIKPGVANANAKMSGHHVSHHKVHRSHKAMGATKTKSHGKVSFKQTKPVSKRG
jgi:hypothetical protein